MPRRKPKAHHSSMGGLIGTQKVRGLKQNLRITRRGKKETIYQSVSRG